jgi:pyrroloquinoline quinone biosynthesis protein B
MRIKVLGSAAGGGFPQWNCNCSNCSGLRSGSLKAASPRTQTQIAVSPSPANWVLLNASPDLRQQLAASPELAPASAAGAPSVPVTKILLTSADVDCVMGLLHLREFQPLHVFCTLAVKRILTEENSMFRVLNRSNPPVHWEILSDRIVALVPASGPGKKDGLFAKAIPFSANVPDYVSDSLRKALSLDEAVIGVQLFHKENKLFFAPALPQADDNCRHVVEESDIALLDGTFWTDNELILAKRGNKSAREMGHIALSGEHGLLRQNFRIGKTRKILIHLNNTNPVLNEDGPENRAVRDAGFEIAYDGMEFEL